MVAFVGASCGLAYVHIMGCNVSDFVVWSDVQYPALDRAVFSLLVQSAGEISARCGDRLYHMVAVFCGGVYDRAFDLGAAQNLGPFDGKSLCSTAVR